MIAKNHLFERLQKSLLPFYILTGDEPLQMLETADSIRYQAKQLGYNQRVIFDINKGFNWDELLLEANSLSLFAEKKILDCRMTSASMGVKGAKALQAYCDQASNDLILILSLPKCTKAQQTTKWFKMLARFGLLLQFQAIEGKALLQWLEQRLKAKNMQAENANVIKILAELVEGNLLAAAQEIDKLSLIYPQQTINEKQLIEAVTNNARYHVFALLDEVLAGEIVRAEKIFNALYAEGIASQIILWGFNKELRLLASLAYQINQGGNVTQVINNQKAIWRQRQTLFYAALQRHSVIHWQNLLIQCSEIDQVLKGQKKGDEWFLLNQMMFAMVA